MVQETVGDCIRHRPLISSKRSGRPEVVPSVHCLGRKLDWLVARPEGSAFRKGQLPPLEPISVFDGWPVQDCMVPVPRSETCQFDIDGPVTASCSAQAHFRARLIDGVMQEIELAGCG